MRRMVQPLTVHVHPVTQHPQRLCLKGCQERVARVLDHWRYGGRWWLGEAPRDHYLLELASGQVVEVARREGAWFLIGTAD